MTPEEIAFEEAKREHCWDSLQHREAIQAMISLIDLKKPVPRNSKAGCLPKQAKLWKSLGTPGDLAV